MNEILEKAKRLNSERSQGDWHAEEKPINMDGDTAPTGRIFASLELDDDDGIYQIVCTVEKDITYHRTQANLDFIEFAPTVYDAYIAAHENCWVLAEEMNQGQIEYLRGRVKEQSELVNELVDRIRLIKVRTQFPYADKESLSLIDGMCEAALKKAGAL